MTTTVMVVEDDLVLRENMVFDLQMRGYDVVEATDGMGALYILRSSNTPPDIILSDIAMPDMDGFQLLEQVRSEPKWQNIPVLFTTAFNTENAIRLGRQLGVDDYIVKPFKMDDVVIAMENKLKRIAGFKREAERSLDAARQTLLTLISHELRTPLTVIYGGSEMLFESLRDASDDTVRQMIDIIQTGANRLKRLTNLTMMLLQIDSGHLKQVYERARREFDLFSTVMDVVHGLEYEMGRSGRIVHFELPAHQIQCQVEGVYESLVTIFEEPLRNACTFSPARGTVRIRFHDAPPFIEACIADDGPGIPADKLDQVWERFVQINREHYENQGAGLGLAVARESARIHGGDCFIECPPDGGTVFTIRLPVVQRT